jgi:hypothetical protein
VPDSIDVVDAEPQDVEALRDMLLTQEHGAGFRSLIKVAAEVDNTYGKLQREPAIGRLQLAFENLSTTHATRARQEITDYEKRAAPIGVLVVDGFVQISQLEVQDAGSQPWKDYTIT